jgi:hypothetical protein
MSKIYHAYIDVFDKKTGDLIIHRENYFNTDKQPNVFISDLRFTSDDGSTIYQLNNPPGRSKLECECTMDAITNLRERKKAMKKAAANEIREILRKYNMGLWLKHQNEIEPMLYFNDDSQFLSEVRSTVKVVGKVYELKK